ncbi:helix-turn-helix domain-containing protein [Timonella senegalensis]|uniref:helix-turn-helix domain-containing protein n=1 Tax=Timonella senegalensis TaxID=1465825 RepID=UPI0028A5E0E9|nr:helix-turn-helix domain-containing protein [Timonella senegalensis]
MSIKKKQFLTVREVADRWQRPDRWVAEQASLGKVKGIKIGGVWRFDPDDIEAYEDGRKTGYRIELATRAHSRRMKQKNASA